MFAKSKDGKLGVGTGAMFGSKNAPGVKACVCDELKDVLELVKDSVVVCIGRGPGGADGPVNEGAG